MMHALKIAGSAKLPRLAVLVVAVAGLGLAGCDDHADVETAPAEQTVAPLRQRQDEFRQRILAINADVEPDGARSSFDDELSIQAPALRRSRIGQSPFDDRKS